MGGGWRGGEWYVREERGAKGGNAWLGRDDIELNAERRVWLGLLDLVK